MHVLSKITTAIMSSKIWSLMGLSLFLGCIPFQPKSSKPSEIEPQVHTMKDWIETRYDHIESTKVGLVHLKNAIDHIAKAQKNPEDKNVVEEFLATAQLLSQTGMHIQSLEEKTKQINLSTARAFDQKNQRTSTAQNRSHQALNFTSTQLFAPFQATNLNPTERASMVDAYTRVLNANMQAASQLATLRNIANVQALENQSRILSQHRQFMDIQGAALDNVGRAINNEGAAISNVLQSLDIPIKMLYIATYNAYRAMYSEYAKAISNVYKRMDRSQRNYALAQRAINQYNRTVQLCESRKNRLSQQKNRLANQELFARNVELNTLTRGFNYFTQTPVGEACLHKSLLTWSSQDVRHLFDIEYKVEVDENGKKPIVACAEMSDAFPGEVDPYEYPQPILDLEAFEPIGFFHPVTHFQIFRLLTETSMDFKLHNPPLRSQGCNRLHPGVRRYFELSRDFEASFAEDSLGHVSTKDLTSYHTTGFTPKRYENQAYTKLMQDFATIFATADQCQKDKAIEENLSLPVNPEGTPYKATDAALTDMNTYFDPNYTLYSESVRSCMEEAEHMRYKAFAFLSTQEKMIQVLNMAASMSAPQPPIMPQSMIMPQQPRR